MNKFLAELRRRNVIRVSVGYLAAAWLIIQLVNELGPIMGAPDWLARWVLVFLALGFVITVILSWIYEFTDSGIRATSEVDLDTRLRSVSGRKLDFVVIGLLLLALSYFIWESRFSSSPGETTPAGEMAIQSIAVLPFKDLSEKGNQAYFAEGMAEELLNALSRVRDLKVSGRSSSFGTTLRNLSLADIATELGVTHVLQGSVRASGTQLRVTAQLVNTQDGFQVWSDEFDGALTDVFEFQDQISAAVVAGLELQLDQASSDNITPTAVTTNASAYQEYLLGRYHLARRTAESLDAALKHFKTAISLDPEYAPSYSALATTLVISPYYRSWGSSTQLAAEVKQAAQKAIAIDPENSEAHAAIGYAFMTLERNWEAAADSLETAIELAPNVAEIANLYGDYLYVIGDYAGALIWESRVVELDPLSAANHHELALVLDLSGRTDEALEQERKAIQLSSEFRNAWLALGRMLIEQGNYDQFEKELRPAQDLLDANAWAWLKARLEIAQANSEKARVLADEALQISQNGGFSVIPPALLMALLGEDRSAARLVEKAYTSNDPILVSPWYFFLPEDFPAMPLLHQALDKPELVTLFNLRRLQAARGRGRNHQSSR